GREMVREPVRPRLEVGVRIDPIAGDQRDPLGDGIDGVLDQVGEVQGHTTSTAVAAGDRKPGAACFARAPGALLLRQAMTGTWTLQLPYRRSVGPVIGAFLGGLRDQTVYGVRTAAGRVIVPPLEYDPDTGDDAHDLVEVGQTGVVQHAVWIAEPLRNHPLD